VIPDVKAAFRGGMESALDDRSSVDIHQVRLSGQRRLFPQLVKAILQQAGLREQSLFVNGHGCSLELLLEGTEGLLHELCCFRKAG
jgi:hypothetical protein